MKTILVTGAGGQIGSDLVAALRERYGEACVIESDLHPAPLDAEAGACPYEVLDVRDMARFERLVEQYRVDAVFHLASLLSVRSEQNPELAWAVNMDGLRNVLDLARRHRLRVFWPSSIAVFGPSTPRQFTPQVTLLDPSTIYGVTKVSGELLCRYYAEKFGVDVRSLRFPGIISHSTPPGGGTTDYAVEIFYAALQDGVYTSFLRPETRLPMMYMPDAIQATLMLMEADPKAVHVRTSYNLAALSFSVEELAAEIARHVAGFTCRYAPDFRQAIADSWPEAIDDARARVDWGWHHTYELPALVEDMLTHLAPKLTANSY